MSESEKSVCDLLYKKGDEIMSDNWVVRNLENALETWNDKLTEIWGLLTATPEEFKGGKI